VKQKPLISDAQIKAARNSRRAGSPAPEEQGVQSFKVLSFDFVDPNAPKAPAKPTTRKAADDDDEDRNKDLIIIS